MCNYRLIILFVLAFLIARASYSQKNFTYTFRHIDQSNGLLHNNVLGIEQDAKGFIWILTANGLQRYDGSRFINFQGIVNNPLNGITNGAELYIDTPKNEVWVQKKSAIEKLQLPANTMVSYNEKEILQNPAFKFQPYTDAYGNTYFLADKGMFFTAADKKKTNWYVLNAYSPGARHSSILAFDSVKNQTWLASVSGMLLFDGGTKKVASAGQHDEGNVLLKLFDGKKITPRLIMIDGNKDYWVSGWGSVFYRFSPKSNKLSMYNLSVINKWGTNKDRDDRTLLINAMYEDNHGKLWIATENAGLLLYHKETDDFENITVDKTNQQGIQYNYKIYCIMQDKEDNIWLGTDNGISIFNPYSRYFKTVQHEDNSPSIPKNEINNYIQDSNGDILVGTWGGGITLYDSGWDFKKTISFTAPFQYNMVWSFIQRGDGKIIAGCQHGYIHLYDPATKHIQTIHPPELENSTIRCMAKDAAGNIWFGLHNGHIAQWNKMEDKFYRYNDSTKNDADNGADVLKIFIDKAQRFWVSTDYGFKQFDPSKRRYIHNYLPDKKLPSSISAVSCQGIEACNDTTLLIGTIYGGLNFFNTVSGTFRHLTLTDGLPSGTVYALKKDSAGFIWFTTDYNLYKFKPPDNKFIRYTIEPGIIHTSFNTNDFYGLKNGKWITASTTEIICFDTQDGSKKTKSETVAITGFKIFDSSLLVDALAFENKPLQLSYRQNFFTIEFALLNFSSLQQTKYYYRLSDVNKDWVSAGTKTFASYTSLAPGKYVFSVRTDDDSGAYKPASFTIIISPPFWQTWWFRALAVFCIVLLLYIFIKRRIAIIKKEATLQQKISETEMMALRAQMNPHFIFNCLNSIDNLIQMDEKEKATLYLSKFAKLIRSILESSAKNVVPCWKDMETLQLYLALEELRWGKKFTYQLIIADEIINGDYKVPPLIIQPFVENAIHHGLLNKIEGDKKLFISVSVVNNYIQYIIEDNGVGRAKANEYKQLNKPSHQSMGLQITTDRIHLFNQNKNGYVTITDLQNEMHQPSGTRVTIELINQP